MEINESLAFHTRLCSDCSVLKGNLIGIPQPTYQERNRKQNFKFLFLSCIFTVKLRSKILQCSYINLFLKVKIPKQRE